MFIPETVPAQSTLPVARSRIAIVAFWVTTLFVAVTGLASGVADILRVQPFFGVLLHLGYPAYFSTLLGLWKLIGAAVLLAPRRALLKEWAYAGMLCDYCSAAYSHLAAGDGAGAALAPVVSLGVLAASWYLRPPARRLTGV